MSKGKGQDTDDKPVVLGGDIERGTKERVQSSDSFTWAIFGLALHLLYRFTNITLFRLLSWSALGIAMYSLFDDLVSDIGVGDGWVPIPDDATDPYLRILDDEESAEELELAAGESSQLSSGRIVTKTEHGFKIRE